METRDLQQTTSVPVCGPQEQPRITGNIVLTASHLAAQKSWTFRVFNPTDAPQTIHLGGAKAWEITNLRGQNEQLVTKRELVITPRQIVTLRAISHAI